MEFIGNNTLEKAIVKVVANRSTSKKTIKDNKYDIFRLKVHGSIPRSMRAAEHYGPKSHKHHKHHKHTQ
eukprot:Pgem_evm2s8529